MLLMMIEGGEEGELILEELNGSVVVLSNGDSGVVVSFLFFMSVVLCGSVSVFGWLVI